MKVFTGKNLLLIFAGALLLAVGTFWVYSVRSPDQPSGISSLSYAAFSSKAVIGNARMSALIGGDVLIGGLMADKLHFANGQDFPVQQSNGLATFTITLPHNATFQATGSPANGQDKGKFIITQAGQSLASGVWSATPVQEPGTVIDYEFLDDSAGVDYSGSLVLGTTHGNLYLPDGTTLAARVQRTGPSNSLSAPVTLFLSLPDGSTLTCIGTPLNSKNTAMQGISGIFQDPQTHRSRVCNALVVFSK